MNIKKTLEKRIEEKIIDFYIKTGIDGYNFVNYAGAIAVGIMEYLK